MPRNKKDAFWAMYISTPLAQCEVWSGKYFFGKKKKKKKKYTCIYHLHGIFGKHDI